MSESFDDNSIVPSESPAPKKRHRWWLYGAIILMSLHLTLVLGYTTVDYLYNIWPQESYRQIYEKPWLSLNVRALKFQNEADFNRAETTLRHHVQHSGNRNNPVPHFLLAELYNTEGKPEKAIPEYQATIRASQNNWLDRVQHQEFSDNAHAALAILDYEAAKTTDAQRELSAISATDENREADILTAMQDSLESPERGDFHLLLGKAFRKVLKFKIATQELQKALALSQNPQTRMEAANCLKTQQTAQGSKDLNPMARYYSLAARSAQTNDENLPQAASLFKKALREAPDFDWGYNELAIIYRQLKDYPTAIAFAQNAISQNGNFYNPYLTLGDIALDQENYPAAITHFQEAEGILKRLPQDEQQDLMANIENQIAYCYESMHQYEPALQHYQSVIDMLSESEEADGDDYNYAKDGLDRVAESKHHATQKTASVSGKQISWKQ